jgi:hypothetical protein
VALGSGWVLATCGGLDGLSVYVGEVHGGRAYEGDGGDYEAAVFLEGSVVCMSDLHKLVHSLQRIKNGALRLDVIYQENSAYLSVHARHGFPAV